METGITVITKLLVTYKIKIMKNFIKNILILISANISFTMNAQVIVDMSSDVVLPTNYNQTGQYYEKDVHNYLNRFVGTWEYINGNEKFQIILTKFVMYHNVTPIINLNFYEDGIGVQYKKFENGNLIFSSPIPNEPNFTTYNGINLEGNITDYGRVTVEVNRPTFGFLEPLTLHKGGEYFYPDCMIELQPLSLTEPPKIKFSLYFSRETGGFGNPHNNPAYNGQPLFSIPSNIIMTKVP